jgi:hypothetical protein
MTAARHALLMSARRSQGRVSDVRVSVTSPIVCVSDDDPVLTTAAATVLAHLVRARLADPGNGSVDANEGVADAAIEAHSQP